MVPDIRFPLARLKWQKQSHVNYFGTAIKDCRWLPRRLPAQRLGRLPLTITAGAGREPNCLTAVFLCYSPRGVGRMPVKVPGRAGRQRLLDRKSVGEGKDGAG